MLYRLTIQAVKTVLVGGGAAIALRENYSLPGLLSHLRMPLRGQAPFGDLTVHTRVGGFTGCWPFGV